MSLKAISGIFSAGALGIVGLAASPASAQQVMTPDRIIASDFNLQDEEINRFEVGPDYDKCVNRISLQQDLGNGISVGRVEGKRFGITIKFGAGEAENTGRKFLQPYQKCRNENTENNWRETIEDVNRDALRLGRR